MSLAVDWVGDNIYVGITERVLAEGLGSTDHRRKRQAQRRKQDDDEVTTTPDFPDADDGPSGMSPGHILVMKWDGRYVKTLIQGNLQVRRYCLFSHGRRANL